MTKVIPGTAAVYRVPWLSLIMIGGTEEWDVLAEVRSRMGVPARAGGSFGRCSRRAKRGGIADPGSSNCSRMIHLETLYKNEK